MHRIAGEFFSSFKPLQLNQKIESHDFSSELADQTDCRLGRPSRGQEIVYDQDPLTRSDGIPMDRQGVRPIFKAVLHLEAIGRQFPRLANRHKPGAQPAGQHASEDKSSRLDTYDLVDTSPLIPLGKVVGQLAKSRCIFQQCRNVVKEDTGLGEIRHFADEGLIIDGGLRN